MPKIARVLFDLDGTLFSSENLLEPAYRDGIEEFGTESGETYRCPTRAEILREVGRPANEIMKHFFGELPEARRAELGRRILRHICRRIRNREGDLFSGVPEMLKRLRGEGRRLYLVSNCRRSYLDAVLDTYDLRSFFEEMACNEEYPDLGKNGLVKSFSSAGEAVLVGDRSSDGEAAREAGIFWIGCAYGYSSANESELREADCVVESVFEIPEAVGFLEGKEKKRL
ncbi:MAG: HAD family hydrolase [Candidatus Hydrogenedentota bacterium]|nr:MAG: HAD family hydrolase [Candidatus Hydrogenedentota bacterium]